MVIITGRIVRGLKAPTGILSRQMPYFVRAHPELDKCKRATINVVLDCEMEAIPDFTIGPFDWEGNGIAEMFGFMKLQKFEIVEQKIETEAWIYIPYNSPHRLDPYYAEILAPELNMLNGARQCRLCLQGKKVIA